MTFDWAKHFVHEGTVPLGTLLTAIKDHWIFPSDKNEKDLGYTARSIRGLTGAQYLVVGWYIESAAESGAKVWRLKENDYVKITDAWLHEAFESQVP